MFAVRVIAGGRRSKKPEKGDNKNEGELIFVIVVLATIAILYFVATAVMIYRAFIEKRMEGIAVKTKKGVEALQDTIHYEISRLGGVVQHEEKY
jgi:hypothetical protein